MCPIQKVDLYGLKVPVEKLSALVPVTADKNSDAYFTFDEVWSYEHDVVYLSHAETIFDKYLNCKPFDLIAFSSEIRKEKETCRARFQNIFSVFKEANRDVDFSFVEEKAIARFVLGWSHIADSISPHTINGAMSLGLSWFPDSNLIFKVKKGSLAEKAGIREGDYLLGVNGISTDINSALGSLMIGKCGETVTMEAFRPDITDEADFTPDLVGLKNLFNVGSVFGAYSIDINRSIEVTPLKK